MLYKVHHAQIDGAVVAVDAVDVIHLLARLQRFDESVRNQSMNQS
jgi:hypothetical protein